MMDAVIALRRAVQARLVADAELSALLGGPRIHDEPPRAAAGPYIVHGDVDARDWSTGTEEGCEQTLSLVVWAGSGGETAVALTIAARLAALLHDAPLAPAGHRLVQIRQTGLDLRRDARTGLCTATVRLRCVTERL
jgi:hypothetical protein